MLQSINIGPLALPTYPLLLLAGFYVGLWLAAKVAGQRGINPDHIFNAGFYAAIAAVAAGRLGHVLLHFPAYLSDPLSVFSPNLAAFQPLFAVAAAVIVFVWYQRKFNIPILPLLDSLAVGALGTLAILAFADGLNGRFFGAPSTLPWAITQWSVARHPVQFYEALGIALVILFIWRFLYALKPGQAALLALGGFAAVRLFVDAFRDQPATISEGFRLTQIVAFVVLVLVLLALYQMQADKDQTKEGYVDLT